MSTIEAKSYNSLTYSPKTIARAKRGLFCSPFKIHLLAKMRHQSVPINAIASNLGVENGYTRHAVSELAADNALGWLIQVGVLRREVDGQGITDSFRLTPLGSQLVEQYANSDWQPSIGEVFYNGLNQWLRWPF
ncbi:Npun_F0494 family protein [Synechocystis sp. PCC 7509]|uniref:Npun_F0494 family protein n=1 Tax=Synechocystis sp. PCC 7509 TaxID=927677 RepID=UPI0002ACC8DB|nr:Npun_F0494 family protein [Synechocystis sp. PCC 7509]